MSKLHKTLAQVKATHQAIKQINKENDLLPSSMKTQLKELELKLFVQSCNLEDIIKEEQPERHLKLVKAS